MTFDFSNLYRTQVIEIKRDGKLLFEVTIQEVSQEAHEDLQREMFSSMDLSVEGGKRGKQEMQRQLNSALKSGKFSPVEFAARQKLLGVQSWTLDTPVTYENWRKLPKWIVELIEKGVDDLNPSLDEEFQS
jgi:hypothetical protein